MPTYSLLDPFEFPYYFYCIRGELIMVLSIVVCIPSTFCPTLGHHQGRICYKSDVTFVLANYYCVRTSLLLEIMALAFKCNSVKNIKQALIDNGFPDYIVDEQIKRMIKNVNQQNKQCTTPSSQQTYIRLFYPNQMHYNYKSDEKIMKTLIHKNILPTDPNKKK